MFTRIGPNRLARLATVVTLFARVLGETGGPMGCSSEVCHSPFLLGPTFIALPILYDWRIASNSGRKDFAFTITTREIADSPVDGRENFAAQVGDKKCDAGKC
jgi:hypothetical protein